MARPQIDVHIEEHLESSAAWSRLWNWLLGEERKSHNAPTRRRGHDSPEMGSDDVIKR